MHKPRRLYERQHLVMQEGRVDRNTGGEEADLLAERRIITPQGNLVANLSEELCPCPRPLQTKLRRAADRGDPLQVCLANTRVRLFRCLP